MSAGFIGLAVAVIFLLAAVTTIIALTNRAFAGHTPGGAPAGHAAPATHQAPATQPAPAGQQPAAQTPPPAEHAPGGH
jgi:hypothetical protein